MLPLEDRVKALPDRSGVYLFRDSLGTVIYVGKATSLRSRVRSYFAAGADLPLKQRQLVARIVDVDFIVTDSEQEALILELNLIKKYHPRYNVRLKDDKTFPYLKIDLADPWPRVYVTRRVLDDGARYFGPFADATSVRRTLKLLQRLFPFRSCRKQITGKDSRPCLEYHIHNCLGPCVAAVGPTEYRRMIDQVILFLEGRQEKVLREIKRQMSGAARALQFEKAALLRDQADAIERVIEGQRIAATVKGDKDAIALAQNGEQACIQVFQVRNSKLIGQERFTAEGVQDEDLPRTLTHFVKQYYSSTSSLPPLVVLQHPVGDASVLGDWLASHRNKRVRFLVPRRGVGRQLVEMAAENARQGLEIIMSKAAARDTALALGELTEKLRLPLRPLRIECYDVSNIHGNQAVGSMAVFENGLPGQTHYRRFRIKTVDRIDDYAMIGEVLRRRFQRRGEAGWPDPDLVVIDGGRGHLNTALEVMSQLGAASIPAASLAKEKEEVFLPGQAQPLVLPVNSPALHLLQRLRDEAHRFAIGYHRKLRQKEGLVSALDGIPGVGPKRRKALITRFGSVEKIREASADELMSVEGVTARTAEKIKEYL